MIKPDSIHFNYNGHEYKISDSTWLATSKLDDKTYQIITDLDFNIEIEFATIGHDFWDNLSIVALNTIINGGMFNGIKSEIKIIPK